ncbi:DinB family protein [Streptomyces sp. NBC_01604]
MGAAPPDPRFRPEGPRPQTPDGLRDAKLACNPPLVTHAGLDDAQVRVASAEPSSLTLLGLVQHLAEVERNWFQRVAAGIDVPPVYGKGNGKGHVLDPERGMGEALAVWKREITRGAEVCAGLSLDDVGRIADGPMTGLEVSLRWAYVHMIEEYARHNGHADILRERIDGVIGA